MRPLPGLGLGQSCGPHVRSFLRALHHGTTAPRHANQTRSRGGSKSRWLGPGALRCLFCSLSSLCRKERTYSPTVQLAPVGVVISGQSRSAHTRPPCSSHLPSVAGEYRPRRLGEGAGCTGSTDAAGGAGSAATRRCLLFSDAAAGWRRRSGGRSTHHCEAVRACLLWPCLP